MSIHKRSPTSDLKLDTIPIPIKSNRKHSPVISSSMTPFEASEKKMFGIGNKYDLKKHNRSFLVKNKLAIAAIVLGTLAAYTVGVYFFGKESAIRAASHKHGDLNSGPEDSVYRESIVQIDTTFDPAPFDGHAGYSTDNLICHDNSCYNQQLEANEEWQVIKKGQNIPAGTHVRLNLMTGQYEAKLWDLSNLKMRPNSDDAMDDQLHSAFLTPQNYNTAALNLRHHMSKSRSESAGKNSKEREDLVIELLSPNIAAERIHTILDRLRDQSFDFFSGINGGDGFEVLGLLIRREGDYKVREKAAEFFAFALKDNPLAQKEALQHRVFGALMVSLSMEPAKSVKVRVLGAILQLISNNYFGMESFYSTNGFDILLGIYEKTKDPKDPLKNAIAAFVAEIFFLERSFVDASIPFSVQKRAVDIVKWCQLLQDHYMVNDEGYEAVEALHGLMITDLLHYGNTDLCPIRSEFFNKVENWAAPERTLHPNQVNADFSRFLKKEEIRKKRK